MATGNYGTIRPADVSVEDVEILYSFSPATTDYENNLTYSGANSMVYGMRPALYFPEEVPSTGTKGPPPTPQFTPSELDYSDESDISEDENQPLRPLGPHPSPEPIRRPPPPSPIPDNF